MKKLFIFFLSSLLAVQTGFAQVERALINIADFKFSSSTIDEIIPAVDDEGLACFSALNGSKSKFALVNPSGEVVMSPSLPVFISSSPDIIGTTTSATSFTFYARSIGPDQKHFIPLQIDKTSGEVKKLATIVPPVDSRSKFVTSFVDDNVLHLIYFQNKNKLLQICRIKDAAVQEVLNFSVDFNNVNDYFTKKGKWIFMSDNSDKTIFSGHHKKKIYKAGNRLTFVFDYFLFDTHDPTSNYTHIVNLYLQEQKVSCKTFLFSRPAPEYNTYLHQNNLFKFSVNSRELKLEVYEMTNLSMTKEFSYTKQEPIAIKATPVYKKSAASIWTSGYEEINETSGVLSKLAKGTPSITIEPGGSNTLVLTMGSYFEPSSGGGGAMMPMGGGTISTPGGPVAVAPTFAYRGFTGFYGNGIGTSTYFKAYLDAATLENAKAVATPGLQDLVDNYEKELHSTEVKVGATAMVKSNNKLLYTYLDKKAKLLKVVAF